MEALEEVIREGHEFGALSSTDSALGFYEHRGWQRWRGPTSALTPGGLVPDDREPVFVLPSNATLDTSGELTCDWRDGDLW